MVQVSEEIPSGFEEVSGTDKKIEIYRDDLPWLEANKKANLAMITLKGTQDRFYFGSLIEGKELVDAANQLDRHRSEIANHVLYSQLPDLIRNGFNTRVNKVKDGITSRPIFYVGNPGGQRVYFMRFDNLDGNPVIIRIAVCDKSRQIQVLKVLTHRSSTGIRAEKGGG